MKHRDFTYTGEKVPEINTKENADFILHFQNSMLQSLVRRKLLTDEQAKQVVEKLQHQAFMKSNERKIKP